MSKEMNVYGLTGNMGCGKSTIGEFLQKHGDVCVLNCDQISKSILFDAKNKPMIQNIFGEEVIEDGMIDSKVISRLIFNDSTKKQALENFLHPLVWQNVQERVQNGETNTIFVVESALIYETKKEHDFKGIIVATCDEKEQFNRIRKRNCWSDDQIEERLKSQLKNSYKEENGLVVINTNCSMQELELKIEQVYSFIKSNESGRLVL